MQEVVEVVVGGIPGDLMAEDLQPMEEELMEGQRWGSAVVVSEVEREGEGCRRLSMVEDCDEEEISVRDSSRRRLVELWW